LELGGKSPYIVFDDADLDSAIEGLVDAIWFNQGQVCCAGSRLLVQEGIAPRFYAKLKHRMDGLRIGDPLDKAIDIGAIVDPIQLDTITRLVKENPEGDHYQAPCPLPAAGSFYPPTLITGLGTASPLMQEEIFGPVLVAMTFRTPEEAVQLANNTKIRPRRDPLDGKHQPRPRRGPQAESRGRLGQRHQPLRRRRRLRRRP
jgi:aldehyde dehydrogenase (NAD+)